MRRRHLPNLYELGTSTFCLDTFGRIKCPNVINRFSTVGLVRASALNGPGGANSLGPVATSPKSRCISTVGPESLQRFTKTRPKHASLERRHATHHFTNRKLIRNKSLELAVITN